MYITTVHVKCQLLRGCRRAARERDVRQEEKPRREADRLRSVGETRPRPSRQSVDGNSRVRSSGAR